jgi:hypothetical protein
MPVQALLDSPINSLVSAALADGCIRVFVVAFFAICALWSRPQPSLVSMPFVWNNQTQHLRIIN